MADADDTTTLRLKITGEVQGVGYRDHVIREATARNLTGWVRNRSDGSVEVVASGPTKTIEEFVGQCMRGPPGARVKNVEMGPHDPPDRMGFSRRPTL